MQAFPSLLIVTGLLVSACGSEASDVCPPARGVAVQVLGSGGPIADDPRAGSGYLVWIDGKSRALIDAGGGSFVRFAEAQASFADLDFIGITHFHADHSAGLPALLKSGNFANRDRDLAIAGPDGSGPFPGLNTFLRAILAPDGGAFGYLAGYLDGTGSLPRLVPTEVSAGGDEPAGVYGENGDGLVIDAIHVPHGIVPSLAFRIRAGDVNIVISGDQNGGNDRFVAFASGADLMIMPMPVPEGVAGIGRQLHAPPSVIGRIADDAHAGKLVLSHFMRRSLGDLDANVAIVREHYAGAVDTANDLSCYRMEPTET